MQLPRWADNPKRPGAPDDSLLTDPQYHGVRLLADLLRAGDDLGGEPTGADVPRLLVPLNVARHGSRIITWLDTPDYARANLGQDIPDGHQVRVGPQVEPCDWTDDPGSGPAVAFGKFWTKPHPELPPGAVLARIGG